MKLTEQELEVYRTYHVPNCNSTERRKINAVFSKIGKKEGKKKKGVSIKHEIKKAAVCFEIRKGGHNYITECARNALDSSRKHRVVDIVNLTTGQEIEIETQLSRAMRFAGEPVMIVLWYKERWIRLSGKDLHRLI